MSVPHEDLTDDIAALLADDGAIDARQVASGNEDGGTSYDVTRRECARWQRAVEQDVSQRQLADGCDHPYPTVKYHARGACYHEHGDSDE